MSIHNLSSPDEAVSSRSKTDADQHPAGRRIDERPAGRTHWESSAILRSASSPDSRMDRPRVPSATRPLRELVPTFCIGDELPGRLLVLDAYRPTTRGRGNRESRNANACRGRTL